MRKNAALETDCVPVIKGRLFWKISAAFARVTSKNELNQRAAFMRDTMHVLLKRHGSRVFIDLSAYLVKRSEMRSSGVIVRLFRKEKGSLSLVEGCKLCGGPSIDGAIAER